MAGFLIVAGLTGALIAFNEELDAWLNPELYVDPAPTGGAALEPQELKEAVERQLPHARADWLPLRHQPGRTSVVWVSPRDANTPIDVDEVFVSPSTGRLVGSRMHEAIGLDRPQLMPFIYTLHYSLHAGEWGMFLFGIAALIWLLDCFVGFYLTLPLRRGPSPSRPAPVAKQLARGWWEQWKPAWKIKTSGSSYRLNFDLHRAGGLWLWVVLFVLAFTSVYFNLNQQVFRPVASLFTTLTPPPHSEPLSAPLTSPKLNFNDAVDAARKQLPPQSRDLTACCVGYMADVGVYRVIFNHADQKSGWFKVRSMQLMIDGNSGGVRGLFGTDTGTRGDAFIALQFPLHSGQFLSMPGRILICLAGLVTAMLSITGVVIWWKKRKARVARRSQPVRFSLWK